MEYTIQNARLTVRINAHGAELQSVKGADGTEYLWQGDPRYWADRSPVLFPYIGRAIDRQYEYAGKTYHMGVHGFAPYVDFEMVRNTSTSITFRLQANSETQKQYPWLFVFDVEYALENNRLNITYTVTNRDNKTMHFAIGGHPGINIPMVDGEKFEDYRIRFSEPSNPQRIIFTPDCYVDDHTISFNLEDGISIPLTHQIFDDEAIVLQDSPKTVIIESLKSGRSVSASFPQMKYIGFWHEVKTDAPYVCIEPWSSLPSPKGEKTILEKQDNLLRLGAGEIHVNCWVLEFN